MASFRAFRNVKSSASPAVFASCSFAAVATTAVPTRFSPTKTARRTAGDPTAGARIFTRSLSRSETVIGSATVPLPTLPTRATCMVSSRVHTEMLSLFSLRDSSRPFIFAKTPLTSPPGDTRRSLPSSDLTESIDCCAFKPNSSESLFESLAP